MGLFVLKSLLEHEKLAYRFEMQENRLTFLHSFSKSCPRLGRERVYIDEARRNSIETAGKLDFFCQKSDKMNKCKWDDP